MRSGNGRSTNFVIISSSNTQESQLNGVVPPHLASTAWIKHEANSSKRAFKDVKRELRRLTNKISEKHVHDTRVALRRWRSIWNVLREDGWESKRCKKRLMKPLKHLQKLLGELRDIDVNLELGRKLGCTDKLLDLFSSRRNQLKEQIELFVDEQDVNGITSDLKRYLKRRAKTIENKLPRAKSSQSAFDHLELYLLHQESVVREFAETAQTPEELHNLRLAIKRWRYLLTEFFGLTNIQLVRAQQLLGQLHDLDRLTPILVHDDEQRDALLHLKERRRDILSQIEEMRRKLPYGLRPQVTSVKAASPAAFGETPT